MLTFFKASKLNCFIHQLKPFWEGKIRKKEIRKKHLRKGKLARCTMMDPASGNSCPLRQCRQSCCSPDTEWFE